MGRVPVRLKEVVYTLSPFEQKIMPGIVKDFGHTVVTKVRNNWLDMSFCVVPLVGTLWYVESYNEAEKQHHRY